jgi:membrane AbrB-like protein
MADRQSSRAPERSSASPPLVWVPAGRPRWVDELARLTGVTRAHVTGIARSFAVALAAGVGFTIAGLPLPWLLGPLTVALVMSVRGRTLEQPSGLVHPMRAVLGVAVGSSFTPALVDKAPGAAMSLALLIPYVAVITALGMVFLMRFARFDRQTAFFASCPGGLADMVMYARESGADLRRVTLVQAARVVTLVFTLPFWLQFVGGLPLGGAMPKALHIWQLTLGDAVVIALLAWGGWRIADRLGVTGSSIVGPMVGSAVVHALGLTDAKVPVELLIVAQATMGLVIGSQFRGISLSELVKVLSWGLAQALILLGAAGAMALATARLTGLDPTVLLLSYAPGGQNEMAIIGLILGVDVAIVALHHLLRVMLVVIGAQIVFQRHPEWRQGRS